MQFGVCYPSRSHGKRMVLKIYIFSKRTCHELNNEMSNDLDFSFKNWDCFYQAIVIGDSFNTHVDSRLIFRATIIPFHHSIIKLP